MNECPHCGRIDRVQKVSAIVQSGTHQIQGEVPISNTYDSDGWKIGTNYESYSGTQQSTLARLLTPKAPEKAGNSFLNSILGRILLLIYFIFAGGFSFILFISIWISEKEPSSFEIFLSGLAWSIIVLGGYILKIRKNQKDLFKAQKWNHSINRWNQLYYCYRDDCIFNPQEGKAYPISELNNVIEWNL